MDTFQETTYKNNPLKNANIFSLLTYLYMFPIFKYNSKKKLTEYDLVEPLEEHKSLDAGEELQNAWLKQCEKKQNGALLRALLKLFGPSFLFHGFLRMSEEIILLVLTPYSLQKLIEFFEYNQTEISVSSAWLYGCVLVLARLIDVVFSHQSFMDLALIIHQMKIACTSLIYRKALRLNQKVLSNVAVGEIINLMSNDVGKFIEPFALITFLWIAPILVSIGIYLLYQQVGVSAFYGIITLLASTPIQLWLSKLYAKLRVKTVVKTDQRIRLTNEIISGIQVIKMYCWEKYFDQEITTVRRKEMKTICLRLCFIGIMLCLNLFSMRVSIFITLVAEVLRGQAISTTKVFVVTAIFSLLRRTVSINFMAGLVTSADINVSVKRIQAFLSLEEKQIEVTQDTHSESTPLINLKNVNARWSALHKTYTLKNINLNITSNILVAIIGPVGCGKSSLFNILIKEMDLESGSINIEGAISYSSQEPWLFSGNVKQNIIFNNEFDEERYQKVVEVCALREDFRQLPHGDKTWVGERGASLSGGQKARINLARCIYKKADIYLLDDPLSAVDSDVGQHLYQKCVKQFLNSKLCILITHQLQFLNTTNKIIIIEDGNIKAEGTYEELQKEGVDFAKLLESPSTGIEPKTEETGQGGIKEPLENIEVKPYPEEQNKEENIGFHLYKTYLLLGGGYVNLLGMFSVIVCAQIFCSYSDYYCAFWARRETKSITMALNSTTTLYPERNSTIYIYICLVALATVFSLASAFYFMILIAVACENLHRLTFSKVLRTTMNFFNKNPSGRILNRFSRDLGTVDETIPFIFYDALLGTLFFIGAFILAIVTDYRQFYSTIVLLIAVYYSRKTYIKTARDFRRIESQTRSPIYSHTASSINGLTTIRSYQAQPLLIKVFDNYHDKNGSAALVCTISNRWFGFWVDVFCAIFVAIAIIIFLSFRKDFYSSDIGLVITQYIALTVTLQWAIRQWSELECQMVSFERVYEYSKIEPEPDRKKIQIPKNWPEKGQIEFRNVSLKYSSHTAFVLRNLSFIINPEEKIGIVGRTGAGKSSLINVFFQLYPILGKIVIDGVNITQLPLRELRSKISIIPQEPFLFSGTVRKNLDPFEEHSDESIWKSLEEVELKEFVKALPEGLHCKISEKGSNFSVGQRQLLCLARALLRNNKILIMDEATANVDPHTDDLIQNTIRKNFAACTVLTIAHRLHTVMDSDKILVMSDGKMEEFGHPFQLLQRSRGILHHLVQSSGEDAAYKLRKLAKENYKSRFKERLLKKRDSYNK